MGRIKLNIRRKIFITFFIFIFVVGAICFLGFYKYHVLNQKLRLLDKKSKLLNNILEARRYEKNFFITLDCKYLNTAHEYVKKSREKVKLLMSKYEKFLINKKRTDSLFKNLSTYEDLLNKAIQDCKAHKLTKNKVYEFPNLKHYQKEIREIGYKCTSSMEEILSKEQKYVRDLIKDSKWFVILILFVFIFIVVGTTLFLFVNVNRPLKNLEDGIKNIAKGHYQQIPKIKTGDEFESLAESLNNMLKELERRNEQLIQSEKMAALGTLTSGVAHEINNPLNNISTSVQIVQEEIEEGGDIEYQKTLLKEVEKEIDRIQDIVRALLEFSRQTSFTLSNENIKYLVDNTVKLIQGEIPTNIRLEVDVPNDIYAMVDARRIQQVLLNLIINAMQAMEETGGKITISAWQDKQKNRFYLQVKDTGPGISDENLTKIFDPFFTTKEVGKGSGLGLSISKGVIEQHGGTIEVQSESGEGATFTISIPIKPEI